MISLTFSLIIAFLSFDRSIAGQTQQAEIQMLRIFHYNECEGKDVANYTLVSSFTQPATCDRMYGVNDDNYLVQGDKHSSLAVNTLVTLANSIYPSGAYHQSERLYLASSGPLQGKYFYEKKVYLVFAYLKKCSSVLGYSYVTSKSAELLINDKLDMNVLISPTGGYEVFKKGCTTVCRGSGYYV